MPTDAATDPGPRKPDERPAPDVREPPEPDVVVPPPPEPEPDLPFGDDLPER